MDSQTYQNLIAERMIQPLVERVVHGFFFLLGKDPVLLLKKKKKRKKKILGKIEEGIHDLMMPGCPEE